MRQRSLASLLALALAACGEANPAALPLCDYGADGGADGGGTAVRTASSAVAAPTNLTAAVRGRRQTSFQLNWLAPSGAPASGYEVRYAKVPITEANFDDAAVTKAVPVYGLPADPGQPEGFVVSNLSIETNYYFAVAAVGSPTTRSSLVATTAATAAHFNVAMVSSGASNDAFGWAINGEGDLNGDGLSDVVVGTFGGGKAYLYLGTATTFAPAAPNVVFTGAGTTFGGAVAQIGDIDHDGLPDLAISDQTNLKVYLYKGRATWPATLTDAQADYVIGVDATYAASAFGASIARLGDFDADGIDDLVIGARNFNSYAGRVIIVRGSAAFTSFNLPNTTRAITIDGDGTLGRPTFGSSVVGLGHFYTATAGTTLVVGAPGTSSSPTANAGRVYAFHGQSGTGGAIALSSADHVIAGPASGAYLGQVLSNLGPVVGQYPNLGIGAPLNNVDFAPVRGGAFITSGTPAAGPLTNKILATMSGGSLVGAVIVGGGLSGQDTALSLVGDSKPDVLLVAQMSGVVTIADGSKLAAPPASVDFSATADVKVPLPSGWATSNNGGSLIPDVNGDGKPDFALRRATTVGAVAIFY
jgi:hypothetical protein